MRPRAPHRSMLLGLLILAVFLLPACIGDDDDDDDLTGGPGQITRSSDLGLPLDHPGAVQAYDRADQLLLDWFIRRDLDAALGNFSSNLRTTWASIFDSTAIEGNCSFIQIEGTVPDQSGTATARYSIDGCRVAPPGDLTAAHINVMVTVTDQNAWVVSVEFD